jgi:hypothetical protein
VKHRMGHETRMKSLLKSVSVKALVKLHHSAQGGIPHEPDRIGKKVKGRSLTGVHAQTWNLRIDICTSYNSTVPFDETRLSGVSCI